MSTKTEERRPGRGIYLLPFVVAAPAAAVAIAVLLRFWPTVQKLLSIMIKLVVKS